MRYVVVVVAIDSFQVSRWHCFRTAHRRMLISDQRLRIFSNTVPYFFASWADAHNHYFTIYRVHSSYECEYWHSRLAPYSSAKNNTSRARRWKTEQMAVFASIIFTFDKNISTRYEYVFALSFFSFSPVVVVLLLLFIRVTLLLFFFGWRTVLLRIMYITYSLCRPPPSSLVALAIFRVVYRIGITTLCVHCHQGWCTWASLLSPFCLYVYLHSVHQRLTMRNRIRWRVFFYF